MTANRRSLVTMTTLDAGTATTPGPAAAAGIGSARLVHHVLFWLKNRGSSEDRDQLVAGLRRLAAIDAIRDLHIGIPAPTEKRDVVDDSYDVSELMVFDSAADQKAYQDHPVHREFVATCGHLWRKVVVYDTLGV